MKTTNQFELGFVTAVLIAQQLTKKTHLDDYGVQTHYDIVNCDEVVKFPAEIPTEALLNEKTIKFFLEPKKVVVSAFEALPAEVSLEVAVTEIYRIHRDGFPQIVYGLNFHNKSYRYASPFTVYYRMLE